MGSPRDLRFGLTNRRSESEVPWECGKISMFRWKLEIFYCSSEWIPEIWIRSSRRRWIQSQGSGFGVRDPRMRSSIWRGLLIWGSPNLGVVLRILQGKDLSKALRMSGSLFGVLDPQHKVRVIVRSPKMRGPWKRGPERTSFSGGPHF